MASRLKLHEELCKILGSRNVYYNPPESLQMNYPCIRYSLAGMDHKRANNKNYKDTNQYSLTVIDRNADSDTHTKILAHFPMCSFGRWYPADNLNHFTLTLYY